MSLVKNSKYELFHKAHKIQSSDNHNLEIQNVMNWQNIVNPYKKFHDPNEKFEHVMGYSKYLSFIFLKTTM